MPIKEPELAMINASVEALKFMAKKPEADTEDIIKHVMKTLDAEGEAKIAAVAAANETIKLKREEPNLSDKQITQQITNNIFHILSSINPEN